MNLLQRLQQASSPAKAQISFIGALVVTLLIAGVWVTTLPIRFSAEKTLTVNLETAEKSTLPSVWSGFSEAIKDQFASVFDALEVPPESEDASLFDSNALTPPRIDGEPLINFNALTSSSSPTTTPAVVPVPVLIQVASTPTGTGTTSTVAPQNTKPATNEASAQRTILIATTTGSGTQSAP